MNDGSMSEITPHAAADRAARESYGRLLAYLARRGVDFAAAEDALGEAFVLALQTWERDGVPANPDAWLLTAARRRLIDAARQADAQRRLAERLGAGGAPGTAEGELTERLIDEPGVIPDERLGLMFACAHPAIDAGVRSALMLHAVLGMEAAQIAPAFLLSASAMSQRLVRAKAKIREARIELEVPGAGQLAERLDDVLEAIYGGFGTAWEHPGGEPTWLELNEQAIHLGRVLVKLMPREPEPLGLLALMLHCHARRDARRDRENRYIPLDQQETARWDLALIKEAEESLRAAFSFGLIGRFQIEGAIQSAHASRAFTGRTDWAAIVTLYNELVARWPTVGALVGRAAAVSFADSPAAAAALIELIPLDRVNTYQPYWALCAHVYRELNNLPRATAALRRALGLTTDPTTRDFLQSRLSTAGESFE